MIKVRFSDLFNELLEFEVELQDNSDRDSAFSTVAWKFLDGFEAKDRFWTDLNGLEMVQRTQVNKKLGPSFFPVSSALALRD